MTSDELGRDAHLELIRNCLARMGNRSVVLAYHELRGGISGSHTFRVELAGGPTVLKVTLATSEPYVVQRAQRELRFYRTLAQEIPLRVPKMLSSYADDAYGSCILLAAYQAAAPPADWREEGTREAARQLARLHARYWGNTDWLSERTWLHTSPTCAGDTEIEDALDAWRRLGAEPKFQQVLAREVYRSLCAKLEHISAVDALREPFPVTLCHGDCHIDNLLRDTQGRLVWADWQMVCVGRGPEDVSFFLQRAAAAGGTVSAETMITTYHRHLEMDAGIQVSLPELKQVMDAFELRMLLLEWPFYLGYASADQVTGMLERIEGLWASTF
jgi:Ser/Thr protein kinase RdoA (MazF antagonist)